MHSYQNEIFMVSGHKLTVSWCRFLRGAVSRGSRLFFCPGLQWKVQLQLPPSVRTKVAGTATMKLLINKNEKRKHVWIYNWKALTRTSNVQLDSLLYLIITLAVPSPPLPVPSRSLCTIFHQNCRIKFWWGGGRELDAFIKVAKFDDLHTLIGSAVTFSAEYVYCGLKCLVIDSSYLLSERKLEV